jgi:Yip1 domain
MTPEPLSAEEPERNGLSEGSRLAGVFFEPTKTFDDVAARPHFWTPLILAILSGLVMVTLVTQHVGWERILRQQMEKNPQTRHLPADQREKDIDLGTRVVPLLYGGSLLGTPITFVLLAAIYLGIAKGIMSAPVTFKQVFAVVAYGWMPHVVFCVITIGVLLLRSPRNFQLDDLLAFHPSAFMDRVTSNKFALSLANSLDLFTLWSLFLRGLGLKASGCQKLSTGSAMAAVFLPWAAWTLGMALLAGLGG